MKTYDIKKATDFFTWWAEVVQGEFITNSQFDKVMERFKINEL